MDKRILPAALLLTVFIALILIVPIGLAKNDKDNKTGAAAARGPQIKCIGSNQTDCYATCFQPLGGGANNGCDDIVKCFEGNSVNGDPCWGDAAWDDHAAPGGGNTWLQWTHGSCVCHNMFDWSGQQKPEADTEKAAAPWLSPVNQEPIALDGEKCGQGGCSMAGAPNHCTTANYPNGNSGTGVRQAYGIYCGGGPACDWCTDVNFPV